VVASGTPCEKSVTVSFSGNSVAKIRRRNSVSSASGVFTWNGRIAVASTSASFIIIVSFAASSRLLFESAVAANYSRRYLASLYHYSFASRAVARYLIRKPEAKPQSAEMQVKPDVESLAIGETGGSGANLVDLVDRLFAVNRVTGGLQRNLNCALLMFNALMR
jgi:hypothetical protein